MLNPDQPQIQQNVNTEITVRSDHGNWTPSVSTNQPTTFTITGSGGSIVSEWIVKADTAIITVLGVTAGQILTITDTVNSEAFSVAVQTVATIQSEITSEGDSVPADLQPPGDNQPSPSDTTAT